MQQMKRTIVENSSEKAESDLNTSSPTKTASSKKA